jgi:hypothetical protein
MRWRKELISVLSSLLHDKASSLVVTTLARRCERRRVDEARC